MNWRVLLVYASILILVSAWLAPAHAGRYELIKGKGLEVCEAYQENLSSRNSNIPVLCNRRVNQGQRGFEKQPEWTRSYQALIETGALEEIDRFLWERDSNPINYFPNSEWRNWRGTPEQYRRAWEQYRIVRAGRIGSGKMVSVMDINNDGKPENVYLDQDCEGSIVLVPNENRTAIDLEKSNLTMVHASRKEAGWQEFREFWPGEKGTPREEEIGRRIVEDALHFAHYDLFMFNQKSYFHFWWNQNPGGQGGRNNDIGRLHLFTIDNAKRREVCTYRFHQD